MRKAGRAVLVAMVVLLLGAGCATAPKEFDAAVKGPQILVEPDTVRLGVANVMGTGFSIRGKGFKPKDSVFIELRNVPQGDKKVNVPIFDAEVDEKGDFTAGTKPGYDAAGLTFKIGVLLRAKTGQDEKGRTTIVVYQPPIPEGSYPVRAVSMESDRAAEGTLLVRGPSAMDRLKDLFGRLAGKIVRE